MRAAGKQVGDGVLVEASDCKHGRFNYLPTDHYIGGALSLYGEYSEMEAVFLRRLLRNGDVVVEVGANIGAITVPMARAVMPDGCVCAFEVQPKIGELLRMNTQHLPIVHYPCGLGDVDGVMYIDEPDYASIGNFGAVSLQTEETAVSVPVRRLDELFIPSPVRLIKIDVEGMELAVLRGAQRFIEQVKPLIYVENDRREKSAALISYLQELGYSLYWHLPPLYNPGNYRRVEKDIYPGVVSINMLAVPRGSVLDDATILGLRPVAGVDDHPIKNAEQRVVLEAIESLKQQIDDLDKRQCYAAAAALTKRALALEPNNAMLWACLGSHYLNMRWHPEALDCLRTAVRLDKDCAAAYMNLGVCYGATDRPKDALAALDKALELKPDYAAAQWDRGLLHLAYGNYTDGWRDYDARMIYRAGSTYLKLPKPQWEGEQDAVVYLHATEQGIGDTVLFSRFIPWAAGRAKKVYCCFYRDMTPLMWEFSALVSFLPEGVPLPDDVTHFCHVGTLPRLYGATLENLPPDPGLIAQRLATPFNNKRVGLQVPPPPRGVDRPIKVGLVWTGSPEMGRNAERSIPLEMLVDLAGDPRVWLYSLQLEGTRDIRRIGAENIVCDLSTALRVNGLCGFASAMTQMDLVITVCTSAAHLAGALGLKAWVLLSHDPYWVWMRGRPDSSWYPSLRLFRQANPDDWFSVMDQVRAAMKEF